MIAFLLSGCDALENAPDLFGNTGNTLSKIGNAYANDAGYLLSDYNVKKVSKAVLPELEAYDFSGPVNSGISLPQNAPLANQPQTSSAPTVNSNKPIIYIAPGHNSNQIRSIECANPDFEKTLITELQKNGDLATGLSDDEIQRELEKFFAAKDGSSGGKFSSSSMVNPKAEKYKHYVLSGSGAKMKIGASSGTAGKKTGKSEYSEVYDIALFAKEELEKMGYQVQMCRTSKDEIVASECTNKQRSVAANKANAACYLNIHEDSGSGSGGHMIVSNGSYDTMATESKKIAEAILNAFDSETTLKTDRRFGTSGCLSSENYTTLNWAKVPTVIIECGYLDGKDDEQLTKESEKRKIAKAIAIGVQKTVSLD